jgi:hypothetical protein
VNAKLTLRLDDDLIRSAQRYSAKSGKSLSQLVADYFFTLIDAREGSAYGELTPRVRSLLGALSGAPADERDYLRDLEDRHR